MILSAEQFRETVEAYLRETGTPATRFGIEAVRDPNFVPDLREGRVPGLRMAQRVLEYIDANRIARPDREAAA